MSLQGGLNGSGTIRSLPEQGPGRLDASHNALNLLEKDCMKHSGDGEGS
jgi:hypothetical protein